MSGGHSDALTPGRGGWIALDPARVAARGATRCVWLIDAMALGRECLARALRAANPALAVAHAATPGECAADAARGGDPGHDRPDIVLLHVHAQRLDGDAVRASVASVREAAQDAPVLVIGDLEDSEQVVAALQSGLRGYFPTSLGIDVLGAAIGLVLAGGSFVPDGAIARWGARVGAAAGVPATRPDGQGLTRREADVLRAVRLGKPNKVIARELAMSEGTVKVHLRNIMKKLSATNRTQLASLGLGVGSAGLAQAARAPGTGLSDARSLASE